VARTSRTRLTCQGGCGPGSDASFVLHEPFACAQE